MMFTAGSLSESGRGRLSGRGERAGGYLADRGALQLLQDRCPAAAFETVFDALGGGEPERPVRLDGEGVDRRALAGTAAGADRAAAGDRGDFPLLGAEPDRPARIGGEAVGAVAEGDREL